MKYLTIILGCLLLSSCVDDTSEFGEGISFLKYYGNANSNIGMKAVGLGNEGYVLGGYTSIADSTTLPDLIRVDLVGNRIWESVIAPDTNNHVLKDMIINSEGDYILLSTVSKNTISVALQQDFRITKVNKSGEVDWFKDFGNDSDQTRNDDASAIIQTADGGYALIGTTQTTSINSDLLVVRTDGQGNKVWDKVYGSSGSLNDEGVDILELPNGNFVWFGTRQVDVSRVRLRLVIANSIGNLIDDISYQPTDDGTVIASVSATAGGIAISNNQLFMTGRVAGYFVALSTNLSGNLIWEVTLDNNIAANEIGTALATTETGGIIITGRTNIGNLSGDIYLISLSSGGGINWEQTYGVTGREFAQSVLQTTDGGYAIFGTVDLDNSNQMMMLMKTNQEGNISE
jgi:hypothetical protein